MLLKWSSARMHSKKNIKKYNYIFFMCTYSLYLNRKTHLIIFRTGSWLLDSVIQYNRVTTTMLLLCINKADCWKFLRLKSFVTEVNDKKTYVGGYVHFYFLWTNYQHACLNIYTIFCLRVNFPLKSFHWKQCVHSTYVFVAILRMLINICILNFYEFVLIVVKLGR